MNGNYVIQPLDYVALVDSELWRALATFHNTMSRELIPDDPERSSEEMRVQWQSRPPQLTREGWIVTRHERDLTLMGFASIDTFDLEGNRHFGRCRIEVLPPHRRDGIGRALLGQVANAARTRGRRLLMGQSHSLIPAGAAFARAAGAEVGLEMTIYQLALSDVDSARLARWRTRAAERAVDYELVAIDGPFTDEWFAPMAAARAAMNEAPSGSLDMEDVEYTPELLREIDASITARGLGRWLLAARRKGGDEIAGYTELYFDPAAPARAHQGDTAVLRAHRQKGLGRWLKAVMLERLLSDRPEVEVVRTANAVTNAPMLRINEALGFAPYDRSEIWQIEVDRADAFARGEAT